MPSFATSRTVRHSATDMFDLVADVERYPDFVPLCTGLSVRSSRNDGERRLLIAAMTVAYGPLKETFTSRVIVDRAARTIRAENVDGPFRHLESAWSFEPMGEDRCTVRFAIAYEFRSRLLAGVMGGLFDRAFHAFADAFEARADAVYGTSATA